MKKKKKRTLRGKVFRCRKCRTVVAEQSSVLPHFSRWVIHLWMSLCHKMLYLSQARHRPWQPQPWPWATVVGGVARPARDGEGQRLPGGVSAGSVRRTSSVDVEGLREVGGQAAVCQVQWEAGPLLLEQQGHLRLRGLHVARVRHQLESGGCVHNVEGSWGKSVNVVKEE